MTYMCVCGHSETWHSDSKCEICDCQQIEDRRAMNRRQNERRKPNVSLNQQRPRPPGEDRKVERRNRHGGRRYGVDYYESGEPDIKLARDPKIDPQVGDVFKLVGTDHEWIADGVIKVSSRTKCFIQFVDKAGDKCLYMHIDRWRDMASRFAKKRK